MWINFGVNLKYIWAGDKKVAGPASFSEHTYYHMTPVLNQRDNNISLSFCVMCSKFHAFELLKVMLNQY